MEMVLLRRIPKYYNDQQRTVRHQNDKRLKMLLCSLGDDNRSELDKKLSLTASQIRSLRVSHQVVVVHLPCYNMKDFVTQ